MRRAVSAVTVTALAFALLVAPARFAAAASVPLPSSIAVLGDSISRGFDVCCFYGDHPSHSWATGDSSLDSIQSHYERIRALNPAIAGHQFSDAVTGAKMSAGPTQAAKAVSQGAQYVAILLGANDLCTSSAATMTPTETFRQQFQSTMSTLDPDRRGIRVFVSSYANCRFDNLATYRFQFSAGDVSVLDFFHPDLDGQRKLAEATWAASWWGGGV